MVKTREFSCDNPAGFASRCRAPASTRQHAARPWCHAQFGDCGRRQLRTDGRAGLQAGPASSEWFLTSRLSAVAQWQHCLAARCAAIAGQRMGFKLDGLVARPSGFCCLTMTLPRGGTSPPALLINGCFITARSDITTALCCCLKPWH